MSKFAISLSAALAVLLAGAATVHAAEPLEGNWKLNLTRSKYNVGPPPREFTISVVPAGNGALSFKVEGVMGDGAKVSVTYTATLDGKEAPVNGDPHYTTVSVRRVDETTYDTVFYKDGKEARADRSVLSEGGRVRTLTARGADSAVGNVAVYEKQEH